MMDSSDMTTATAETAITDGATEVADSTETSEKVDKRKLRKGFPPEAIDARVQRAKYRHCAKAAELLKQHGWKVEEPPGWESPEHIKARTDFEKAMATLKSLGIDPSTVNAVNGNGGVETGDESNDEQSDDSSDESNDVEPTPPVETPAVPHRARTSRGRRG